MLTSPSSVCLRAVQRGRGGFPRVGGRPDRRDRRELRLEPGRVRPRPDAALAAASPSTRQRVDRLRRPARRRRRRRRLHHRQRYDAVLRRRSARRRVADHDDEDDDNNYHYYHYYYNDSCRRRALDCRDYRSACLQLIG